MIILIHNQAFKLVEIRRGSELISGYSSIENAFWSLAERFPKEIIGWCEESLVSKLNLEEWHKIFHQDLVLASYSVNTTFLPPAIGYVDQLPFINVDRRIKYPTWQMSTDVGGGKGEMLVQFKSLFSGITDFGYLINSIAKIGQQNSLFCYNEPSLLKSIVSSNKIVFQATQGQLFSFVYQYYNSFWISILLWCFIKYEGGFPFLSYIEAFFYKNKFRSQVNLSEFHSPSSLNFKEKINIDVIIPTISRSKYLHQVMKDLSEQSLLPKKVIVIEQNPKKESTSDLDYIRNENWPFEIIHHFIHETGACNARNIALKEVESDWIFFADDDIRLKKELIKEAFVEIEKYNIDVLNMNCKQEGQLTIFKKIKQWGAFGSGTSFVRSESAKKCHFSSIYEHGYGEDTDFGMQLRQLGCDIVYHPKIEILHLKAPMGGFREKPILAWEQEELLPKPSPTLMAFSLKYYTPQQIKGFKTSLFLKYYFKQPIKNPFAYIKDMRKRWSSSEKWAKILIERQGNNNIIPEIPL